MVQVLIVHNFKIVLILHDPTLMATIYKLYTNMKKCIPMRGLSSTSERQTILKCSVSVNVEL
jgi:hypothetical protein